MLADDWHLYRENAEEYWYKCPHSYSIHIHFSKCKIIASFPVLPTVQFLANKKFVHTASDQKLDGGNTCNAMH